MAGAKLKDRAIVISAALNFLNRNSISVAMSATVLTLFVGYIAIPQNTTIDGLYERYLAQEELKPRVFETGIAIRLNREAPPIAALEEALREQPWTRIERNPSNGVAGISLQAGTPGIGEKSQEMARRIVASNRFMWDRIRLGRTITMPAAVIAPPVRLAKPGKLREGVAYVQAQRSNDRRPVETLVAQPELKPELKPDQQAAPANRNVATISLSKAGLTRDQLLATLLLPFSNVNGQSPHRETKTIFQPRTRARTIDSYTTQGRDRNTRSWNSTPIAAAPANVIKPMPSESYSPSESFAPMAHAKPTSESLEGMRAPAGRQIMIRGTLELANGLALTHARDRIAVVRESKGRFIESGSVWLREAKYEIFVESMEGNLVAELRSPQGEVIGRGQIALAGLEISDQQKLLEHVVLKVRPVATGIAGRVQSAYSSSSTGTLAGARAVSRGIAGAKVGFLQTPSSTTTVSGGLFEEPKFTEGSRVVAAVKAKDHWVTMANVTTGQEPILPVFPKKMMEALVSLTAPSDISPSALEELKSKKGIVWGRVVRGSEPVAGAKIEVLTDGIGEAVYFNELMLPDPKRSTTGANGLFAITGATEGIHALQVLLASGKKLSDPVYFQTSARSVFSMELDVLKASESEGRIYEAFRPEVSVPAELRVLGHMRARRMQITGDGSPKDSIVKLAHLGMPTILDVAAGPEYLAVRIVQNPETRNLDVPMVSRTWYDGIVSRTKFNAPPASGNVIGFLQGMRYRVVVQDDSLTDQAKVVYFDDRGEISSREYGEPGGGFLLLGLKDGLRTVLIEAEGTGRLYAVTVLVQEGIPASISHWLR